MHRLPCKRMKAHIQDRKRLEDLRAQQRVWRAGRLPKGGSQAGSQDPCGPSSRTGGK